MRKADTMRRGESAGLELWSRYQTTAVTGTRKLPSRKTVGRTMRSPVPNTEATAAAQRASPMRKTAHQRGAQLCPFSSPRALWSDAKFFITLPPVFGHDSYVGRVALDGRDDGVRHRRRIIGTVTIEAVGLDRDHLDSERRQLIGQCRGEAFVVDEHINTPEPVDRLTNRLADLVRSSDVELEDERLRRVSFDQVAESLRRPSRDHGSLTTGQDRVGQCPAHAGGRSRDEPHTLVGRRSVVPHRLQTIVEFRPQKETARPNHQTPGREWDPLVPQPGDAARGSPDPPCAHRPKPYPRGGSLSGWVGYG